MNSRTVMSMDVTSFNRRRSAIHAAVAALPALMQQELVTGVENAARQIAVDTLKEYTPVRTGALQASTVGIITVTEGQVSLELQQPAENSSGEPYVQYVVHGHHTRSGSFVPPNPYPQEAFAAMRPGLDRVLREAARRVAMRTVAIMGAVEAL